jgi:hypothetical protein
VLSPAIRRATVLRDLDARLICRRRRTGAGDDRRQHSQNEEPPLHVVISRPMTQLGRPCIAQTVA